MFDISFYEEYIEENLEKLKDIVCNNKYSDGKSVNFISEYELEDELSEMFIDKVQKEFMKRAKAYLAANHKGKFIMYNDWCVHICTIGFYERSLKGYLRVYEEC